MIPSYERSIEALDEVGFVEIDRTCRCIYAEILPKWHKFKEWMDACRDAEEAWFASKATSIPRGGPVNTMKHRHLVEGVGFTPAAIDDILDRARCVIGCHWFRPSEPTRTAR